MPNSAISVSLPRGPAYEGIVSPAFSRASLRGRGADLHEDRGDGAGGGVPVGDGQRDALALLVGAQDDEVAGPRRLGDLRRLHGEEVDVGDDHAALNDRDHGHLLVQRDRAHAVAGA